MILLISDTCRFCEMVKDVDRKYKNIHKFNVVDGVADVNGVATPLAAEILELPCLIDNVNYIFRADTILAYLEKSGELNATADIL